MAKVISVLPGIHGGPIRILFVRRRKINISGRKSIDSDVHGFRKSHYFIAFSFQHPNAIRMKKNLPNSSLKMHGEPVAVWLF